MYSLIWRIARQSKEAINCNRTHIFAPNSNIYLAIISRWYSGKCTRYCCHDSSWKSSKYTPLKDKETIAALNEVLNSFVLLAVRYLHQHSSNACEARVDCIISALVFTWAREVRRWTRKGRLSRIFWVLVVAVLQRSTFDREHMHRTHHVSCQRSSCRPKSLHCFLVPMHRLSWSYDSRSSFASNISHIAAFEHSKEEHVKIIPTYLNINDKNSRK